MVIESDLSTTQEWITEEEKALVLKLREKVQNEVPSKEMSKSEDDQVAYFLRFLRARNLNMDKAESMLLSAIQWRIDNDVDKALELELDPFLVDTYRWTFVGRDKAGHPVAICPFREWDFRKAVAANKMEEFDVFTKHYFETVVKGIEICNKMRKEGDPPVTQFFPICDVNEYPYGQMLSFGAMRKWFQMAATYEAYYPEILFKAVFINCPSFFQLFLNMFKGVFAPRTLAKITCYNTVDDWKKDVEHYMDPAILPEEYGGTCPKQLLGATLQVELDKMDEIFKK